MGYPIQQNQTAQPLQFLMVDETDGKTGLTGLSPTVTIRKVGGSYATPEGAVSEVGNGVYEVAGHTDDANTLGPLLLHAEATGADPVDDTFHVVAYNPQSATNLGLSGLPTANPGAENGLATLDANGRVPSNVTAMAANVLTASATADNALTAAKFASGAFDAVWTVASRTLSAFGFSVTVGTNNDKTDYSLTTAPPTAADISTQVASDLATAHGAGSWETATGFALAEHWTEARAEYQDKLNVSGTLAHSDAADTYKADVSGLSTFDHTSDKVTPIDVDGITHASAMELIMAVLAGEAEVSGNDVVFKKRDGTTTKATITYTATDGERTASVIS